MFFYNLTIFLGGTENGRSWPVLAGLGRSWPVQEKIKSQNFSKNYFFLNFEAKHTKGLKPFRAHSGYRNLLGVRGSPFTEEKVWWTGQDRPRPARTGQDRPRPARTGQDRPGPARTGHFQCPRSLLCLVSLYR